MCDYSSLIDQNDF